MTRPPGGGMWAVVNTLGRQGGWGRVRAGGVSYISTLLTCQQCFAAGLQAASVAKT